MLWTRSSTPLHLFGELAVDAVDEQLGVAEHGVERGAQLVAHIGEELRLVLARERKRAALLLDLAEQPGVLDRQHRLAPKVCISPTILSGNPPAVFLWMESTPKTWSAATQRHYQHRPVPGCHHEAAERRAGAVARSAICAGVRSWIARASAVVSGSRIGLRGSVAATASSKPETYRAETGDRPCGSGRWLPRRHPPG